MSIDTAAEWIAESHALLVSAGAGMGVDSGLPDFRGNEGFWRAYPPMRKLGLSFAEMVNPRWFRSDPTLAWGFYGHRAALYRRTEPHDGYAVLRRLSASKPRGSFVFTSNVDGAFQKASFDDHQIFECHGALSHLQCTRACGQPLFSALGREPHVDEETFRALEPLPACPSCGGLARPNVLMFGDFDWDGSRSDRQQQRFAAFVEEVRSSRAKLTVIECGAGSGIPTVRNTSEGLCRSSEARLVRINVREPEVPSGQVGLALGALDALRAIDVALGRT